MLYTIYQVTHKESDKVYIGKHQTNDPNDGYMGSGQLIRRAVKKYGVEAFEKEVLHIFETEEEMNAKEAELVTEEFCLREDTYNLCPGGQGGFGYIRSSGIDHGWSKAWKIDPKKQRSISSKGGKSSGSANMAAAHRAGKIKYATRLGFSTSEVTKQRISQSMKGKGVGQSNSQFGSRWAYNPDLKISKKFQGDLPDGWLYGRKKF